METIAPNNRNILGRRKQNGQYIYIYLYMYIYIYSNQQQIGNTTSNNRPTEFFGVVFQIPTQQPFNKWLFWNVVGLSLWIMVDQTITNGIILGIILAGYGLNHNKCFQQLKDNQQNPVHQVAHPTVTVLHFPPKKTTE